VSLLMVHSPFPSGDRVEITLVFGDGDTAQRYPKLRRMRRTLSRGIMPVVEWSGPLAGAEGVKRVLEGWRSLECAPDILRDN
jgi:hypothetical protein